MPVTASSLTFDREGDADRAVPRLLGLAAGAQVERVGAHVALVVDGGAQLAPKLLRGLDDEGITVASVEVARPTLDDVFLNLTGRSLRDEGTAAPSKSDADRSEADKSDADRSEADKSDASSNEENAA